MTKLSILLLTDEVDKSSSLVLMYLKDRCQEAVDVILPSKGLNAYWKQQLPMRLASIKSSWLRRGWFSNLLVGSQYISVDRHYLDRALHAQLEGLPLSIGSLVHEYTHNKLLDLIRASKVGLMIPDSYLVESRQEALDILRSSHKKEFITKSISNPKGQNPVANLNVSAGQTVLLAKEEVDDMPDGIELSLVQERIPKIADIRVFYLKEKMFGMAIFSQKNARTAVDFRNYDTQNPNRNVPFKLPESVSKKLIAFMNAKDLNCGSIDLIYSTDEQFYFLEVNAVGQFDWLSSSCNYYLERRIAMELSGLTKHI